MLPFSRYKDGKVTAKPCSQSIRNGELWITAQCNLGFPKASISICIGESTCYQCSNTYVIPYAGWLCCVREKIAPLHWAVNHCYQLRHFGEQKGPSAELSCHFPVSGIEFQQCWQSQLPIPPSWRAEENGKGEGLFSICPMGKSAILNLSMGKVKELSHTSPFIKIQKSLLSCLGNCACVCL